MQIESSVLPEPEKRAFNQALSVVIASTGSEDFYAVLAKFLADITGCSRYLVVSYTAYDLPVFLVDQAMGDQAIDLYLSGLYRLDPLQTISRSNRDPMIVSLKALQENLGLDERYMLELFKSAFIFDELAVLLPAPGGITIAVCCERTQHRFQPQDVRDVESLLPILTAAHRVYMERSLSRASLAGDKASEVLHRAVLILDKVGDQVYASRRWQELVASFPTPLPALNEIATAQCGQFPLGESYMLHWEGLPPDFTFAPEGKIISIERITPGPMRLTLEGSVADFRTNYGLTDRESDILKLVLVGNPNSRIAKSLGISVGTVKNHRYRLYNKLDITTERELFSTFLQRIVESNGGKVAGLDA